MSLNVRQCKRCKKIFQYSGSPICQVCTAEIDKQFDLVRNYMYEHPKCNIEQVVEDTGVAREHITRWLKDGRLLLSDDAAALLTCESCGAPVISGKFCKACTQQVKSQLGNTAKSISNAMAAAAPKPKPTDDDKGGPRMHVGFKR